VEKHQVSRLVGAPPGYVGYSQGGTLTEAVRRRPYQVILFDEVEKAHDELLNILLQVLDEGRLTDGQGRTADFRNTIIALTSNLGSEAIARQIEPEDMVAVRPDVMLAVRERFRPEFLNRLDEIVLFRRLSRADMTVIVDIQLGELKRRLSDRGIMLELDLTARNWLANAGYDPIYGARPLRRVIQRNLCNDLSRLILASRVGEGDTVRVTADHNGLVFPGLKLTPRVASTANVPSILSGIVRQVSYNATRPSGD
jgi:ATP-dependent Clp protease ATP-binding subunit ClpB